MTTATTTEATSRPLTAQLVALLNLLAAGTGGGCLSVRARSYAGLGFERLALPVERREFVPDVLLRLYEAGEREITVSAAVRGTSGDNLLRVGVLVARFDVPAALDRREGWQPDPEGHVAVARRLAGFRLAATAVIDGVREVVALWALADPLALDDAAGVERARALHRRLAARLQASTEPIRITTPSATMGPTRVETFAADDPAGWWVRLPGAIVSGLGDRIPYVVTVPVLDEGRTYTVNQIERACAQEEAR